jgi:hypothetical protein
LVRAGGADPDPIFLVLGGALFYVSTEAEVFQLGGFDKVQIKSLGGYRQCPVEGTLIRESGDTVGYIYVSDGERLNWVKSPEDLEQYCGGISNALSAPRGSLSSPAFRPPLGTCSINRN